MSTKSQFNLIKALLVVAIGLSILIVVLPMDAASISLSGTMINGDVSRFQITRDSQNVVFASNDRIPGLREFYRVSINGGDLARLSTELTFTKQLNDYRITPDGHWLLYSVTFPQDLNHPYDQKAIYRHPLDDSETSILLSQPLSPDSYIMYYGFGVSSDSQYIVYRVCNDSNSCHIFSAPIDGSSPPIQLNKPLPPGGTIWEYKISPDGKWVAFLGEQDTDGVIELYSVPIGGPNTQVKKLNSPLISGGDVSFPWFISNDSQWVIYKANQNTLSDLNLYSVPINGSQTSTRLDLPSTINQPVYPVFLGNSINNQVLYLADLNPSIGKAIYRVPIQGPAQASIQLSGPISPSYQIIYGGIGDDLTHVSYTACTNCGSNTEQQNIYGVPLAGSSSNSVLLVDGISPSNIYGGGITPDGQYYLYSKSDGLYRVSINGPASSAVEISNTRGWFKFSPDKWRMIIWDNNFQLHSLSWAGTHTETLQISGSTEQDIVPYQRAFQFTPDGTHVIYMSKNANNRVELYTTQDGYFLVNRFYLPVIQH